MPKELRQVAFQPQETLDAVKHYHAHRKIKLPAGQIDKFIVGDTPTVTLTLHIQSDNGIVQTVVGTEVLAAALILHCINNKIPLPAEGNKSLKKIGDDVVSLFVSKDSRRAR